MSTKAKSPPHELLHRRVRTQDQVPIAYTWWRAGSPELVILAPGFWRVRLARENLYLAQSFLRRGYDVVTFDFRGHGDSGGAYTFGANEALDLAAVVEQLVGPGLPYARFSVIGLSMGGSIAADALARFPHWECRALAMISSPADVAALRPRPWRAGAIRQVRLRNVFRMPRLSTQTLLAERPSTVEAVSRLRMPKLIVSAEGDWLVDPSHGRILAEAAAAPVEHIHLDIPGSLHADALVKYFPLRILRLLHGWFAKNAPP
jgi:pimeloyl-ACP methyl ester carboxylesterase